MFYDVQPEENKRKYREMLSLVGSLSNLFSASNEPFLHYRAHENIFCKYFEAENLARADCSADATKDTIGIGLKTWVGRNDQKVAEFGDLRPTYEHLTGEELVRTIAGYRNTRIRTTMNVYGLNEMIYHVVKRVPAAMRIYECAFHYIDMDNIVVDPRRGNANNTYFSDGICTYHFSMSKNTLYMLFDDLELMDEFDVEILDDPYDVLRRLLPQEQETPAETIAEVITGREEPQLPQLCLRLYAVDRNGNKYVPDKSGLNQWNAGGRERNANEFYIAYNAPDRERYPNFFPPKDTIFELYLPDGTPMTAKVCQNAYPKKSDERVAQMTQEERLIEYARRLVGKSIMSNPNKALGKWLLRDVFELPENTIVTYDMLCEFGIDSVLFTKLEDGKYSIDFCPMGTYENMYDENNMEEDDE